MKLKCALTEEDFQLVITPMDPMLISHFIVKADCLTLLHLLARTVRSLLQHHVTSDTPEEGRWAQLRSSARQRLIMSGVMKLLKDLFL